MTRVGLVLALLCACHRDPRGVEAFDVADPRALWLTGDFEQVMSPIRFPSPEAHREQVEVWLSLDASASITSLVHDDGTATLRFGPGTRADRLEWNGDGEQRRIVDVRGTWIDELGACSHHVLRPIDHTPNASLVGMRWPCDDASAAIVAGERMRARLEVLPPFSAMTAERRITALDGFARQLDCDGCHREDRPDAQTIDEHGAVWRGTDVNGFFAPAASLRDRLPLEGYGAFDLNVDDPAITVACATGHAERVERNHGAVRWTCADRSVPIGRFDWGRAVEDDPARVESLCRWRRWLEQRLDPAAKPAFAAALAPCEKIASPP